MNSSIATKFGIRITIVAERMKHYGDQIAINQKQCKTGFARFEQVASRAWVKQILGLYSLSGKTYYLKISR